MIQLFRAIFLGLVTIFGVAFIAALVITPFALMSDSNKFEAYNECQMRQIENAIPDDVRNFHNNYCMVSHGYRLKGCSDKLPYLPNCYVSKWVMWTL